MASAGANLDVALLSSGIYEALVTTVGLDSGYLPSCLQLPQFSRIDHLVNKAEAEALEFMDLRTNLLSKTVTERRKRKSRATETFSMSSMTDVVKFLLLIFFMVTSTMVVSAFKVTLPQSSQQAPYGL